MYCDLRVYTTRHNNKSSFRTTLWLQPLVRGTPRLYKVTFFVHLSHLAPAISCESTWLHWAARVSTTYRAVCSLNTSSSWIIDSLIQRRCPATPKSSHPRIPCPLM
ncbi:hypothetical protein QCA50_010814 [Cerrena zonata]|uniref:Uncharacterized protein n=1 Tax=Cerrena zonata TaxID=2478898 RepID=A0AAW0FWZ1_9APHY